jgi:anti-sigma regulatory factor (Ser/Thr protein kinase)
MGERDSEAPEISAVLGSDDMLADAVALARNFAQKAGLASDDQARLCILVEELVANLADHGTPGPNPPRLLLLRRADAVQLSLADSGTPFDPRLVSGEPEQRERGGGAGLAIVRAWADIVNYSSTAGVNRLEVRFPLGGARGGAARSTVSSSDEEQQT